MYGSHIDIEECVACKKKICPSCTQKLNYIIKTDEIYKNVPQHETISAILPYSPIWTSVAQPQSIFYPKSNQPKENNIKEYDVSVILCKSCNAKINFGEELRLKISEGLNRVTKDIIKSLMMEKLGEENKKDKHG
jgi:hypothetical protein